MKDKFNQEVVVGNYVVSSSGQWGVDFGVVTRVGEDGPGEGWLAKRGTITVCEADGPHVRKKHAFVVVPRLCVPGQVLQDIHAALDKMKTKGKPIAVVDPILEVAEDALRSKE
jgi:hypothetical protein